MPEPNELLMREIRLIADTALEASTEVLSVSAQAKSLLALFPQHSEWEIAGLLSEQFRARHIHFEP